MRWHDLLFGSLLTVSIIDFALAAPVLLQERRRACVDAVHAPKDGVNVLEKRVDELMDLMGGDEYWKLMDEFFGSELPKTPESSSSAPLGPDHESNLHMAGPPPNVEPSTSTNPADEDDFVRLLEEHFGSELPKTPESSSSAPLGPDQGSNLHVAGPAPNPAASYTIDFAKPPDDYFKMGQKPVESSEAQVSSSAAPLPWPNYPPKLDVPALAPNLASPTVNPDPLMGPPSVLSTESRKGDMGIHHSLKMAKLTGESPSVWSTESRGADLRVGYAYKMAMLKGSTKTSEYPVGSSGEYGWKRPAPSWPNYGSMTDMQAAPNLASSTVNPAPLMNPPSLPGQTFEPTPLGPPQPPRETRKRPRPGPPTSIFDYDHLQDWRYNNE